jgi:hypothetical protein
VLRFKEYLLEANEIVPFGYKDIQPDKRDHRDHVLGQFLHFIKSELPNIKGDDAGIHGEFKKHLDESISKILGDDSQYFGELHKTLTTRYGAPDLYDALQHITKSTRDSLIKKRGSSISERDYDSIADTNENIRKHIDKQADINLKKGKQLIDIKI